MVWWHIWQRVTGRWVTVTGKRREPVLPVTSCSASPAAVATPCPVLAAPFTACGIPDCAAYERELRWHRRWCPGDDVRGPVVPARGRRETVPPASRFPGAAPGSSPSQRAARALHQPWRAQRTTQSCAGHVSSRPREGEAARSGGLPGRGGAAGPGRQAGEPRSRRVRGPEGRRTCPAGDCPPAPPLPLTRGQDFLARPRARPRDNDTAPRGPFMDRPPACG